MKPENLILELGALKVLEVHSASSIRVFAFVDYTRWALWVDADVWKVRKRISECPQQNSLLHNTNKRSILADMRAERIILGIDPGLANTGWGVVRQSGSTLSCLAYGCVSTPADVDLSLRLLKIHDQIGAVIQRYQPTCVGIETVWFGQNITAAFATGQARGAALVACANAGLDVGEFSPKQIKLAVVGAGGADKSQIQYMVRQLLALDAPPKPDHAADALAAAICYTTHQGYAGKEQL